MSDMNDTSKRNERGGEGALSGMKARAGETLDAAREEAAHRAEGAKSSIAAEISDVARALRSASDEMRERSTSRSAVDWVADSLDNVSDSMRNRETSQLMSDFGSFARRNPALFLGGAALVGFAISRFAKASAHHSKDEMRHEHWTGMDEDSTASGVTPQGGFAGGMDETTGVGNTNFNQAGATGSKGNTP